MPTRRRKAPRRFPTQRWPTFPPRCTMRRAGRTRRCRDAGHLGLSSRGPCARWARGWSICCLLSVRNPFRDTMESAPLGAIRTGAARSNRSPLSPPGQAGRAGPDGDDMPDSAPPRPPRPPGEGGGANPSRPRPTVALLPSELSRVRQRLTASTAEMPSPWVVRATGRADSPCPGPAADNHGDQTHPDDHRTREGQPRVVLAEGYKGQGEPNQRDRRSAQQEGKGPGWAARVRNSHGFPHGPSKR